MACHYQSIKVLHEKKINNETSTKIKVISPVFMVCDAYESGYGKGYDLSTEKNPFTDPDCAEAYKIGYEKGKENKVSSNTLMHNCKSAATMLELVNENLQSGATSSQYSRIKLIIGLLSEALRDA